MKLKWWDYIIVAFEMIRLIYKQGGVTKALAWSNKEVDRVRKEMEERDARITKQYWEYYHDDMEAKRKAEE